MRLPHLGLLLLAALLVACAEPTDPRPNIVLIEVEGLRVDHLNHAGYARPTAVGLDPLFERAAFFSHVRAPSSATHTSSASLLTGLSPTTHGVTATGMLPGGVPTFATVLGRAGWRTHGLSHHAGLNAEQGFAAGYENYVAGAGDVEKYPDAVDMLGWLREWIAREPPRPFFLYLHPMNTHAPYRVPETHRTALLGRAPSLALPWGSELMRAAQQPGRRRARQAIGDGHVQSLVDQYDTAVRYTLDRVGDMLAMLEQSGRLRDAIVVVTSNHGEELFDHQGFGHGRTLFEEGLRVPLYLRAPGIAPARIDTPIALEDVLPTVLELAGVEAPRSDGISHAAWLRGEGEAPKERAFIARLDRSEPRVVEHAIHEGRYKLIDAPRRADGSRRVVQLFDLSLDPEEKRNVAGESPEAAERLRATLAEGLRAQDARQ